MAKLKQPKILAVLIPVAILFAYVTINRNMDWADNYTLFSADVAKSPNDSRLNCSMGTELQRTLIPEEKDSVKRRKIYEESIGYLQKALAIYPGLREAHSALVGAYSGTGQMDSAEFHAKRALEIKADDIDAIGNMAAVYGTEKRYAESIEWYKKAIAMAPDNAPPYSFVGLSYFYLGNFDSGILYLNRAIKIDPDYNASYELLASGYKALNKMDSAHHYESIAQKYNHGFKL